MSGIGGFGWNNYNGYNRYNSNGNNGNDKWVKPQNNSINGSNFGSNKAGDMFIPQADDSKRMVLYGKYFDAFTKGAFGEPKPDMREWTHADWCYHYGKKSMSGKNPNIWYGILALYHGIASYFEDEGR